MLDEQWEKIRDSNILLDQSSKQLEIQREEVELYYEPLARACIKRMAAKQRQIVAIAGPPGSGKSAFAETLVIVLNTIAGASVAATVGQDGWHYPNNYLDTHTIESRGVSALLRQRKGAPETYDQQGILDFLRKVKREDTVSYPVYSRKLHDPIQNAGTITAKQRCIVIEGNYLLLQLPLWNEMKQYYDLSIFLSADADTLVGGLRERHLRGGKTPEVVEQQIQTVDLPNILNVLENSSAADVLVRKADNRGIIAMEWNSQ